jgi:hypothetical protein
MAEELHNGLSECGVFVISAPPGEDRVSVHFAIAPGYEVTLNLTRRQCALLGEYGPTRKLTSRVEQMLYKGDIKGNHGLASPTQCCEMLDNIMADLDWLEDELPHPAGFVVEAARKLVEESFWIMSHRLKVEKANKEKASHSGPTGDFCRNCGQDRLYLKDGVIFCGECQAVLKSVK